MEKFNEQNLNSLLMKQIFLKENKIFKLGVIH